jgi:uncharacterized delta-60 repeat protein
MRSLLQAAQVAAFPSHEGARSYVGKTALHLISVVALLVGGAVAGRGQSALDGFDPNANGAIRVVVVQPDGKILLGGDFTTLAPNGGATVTRNRIARLNPDGTLDTVFNPNADLGVRSIVLQPDGKILVCGLFNNIGGQSRRSVARLDPITGLADSWRAFYAGQSVDAIAVQADGKILLAGNFFSAGGQPRNGMARVDGTVGDADSFNPNTGGVVTMVVLANGKILAGGSFVSIGGRPRNGIARLDPATGLADAAFDPNATGGAVLTIAVQADGKILAGGQFTNVGGQPRNRIARLDANTGLPDSFNPNASDKINSIAVQPDGKILAGGAFATIGGQTRNRIARLAPNTGLADSFDANASAPINSVAVQADGKVLAGGDFITVAPNGGAPVTRNRIARLEVDGRLDRTLDLSLGGIYVTSTAVQPDGKILIGGSFSSVLGVTRNNMARLNPDGTLDTAFNPNANGQVDSIATQADGKILAGGPFTTIGGQTRNRIARLDATTGLADSFDPNANGVVISIAVQADGKILTGGAFNGPNSIGGQTRNNIARLDPTTGLADSFNPNANNSVESIAVQADGRILAGGTFTGIGGQTRNRIARLDATTGLADSFDPNANGEVLAIAVQADGKVLAGGVFFGANSIGGQTRNNIARLDATTGLADSFNPDANSRVSSIAVQADGKIFAAGNFNSIGGQTRNRIARLDPNTGLADSFDPNASAPVNSVAVQADGKVLAGGPFAIIDGRARDRFARLSNDTAALKNLAVTQNTITWALGGSSPQFTRVSFESSPDNVNYIPLGNGTAAGSSWTLTGLSLSTGQNLYIRAHGYYRSGIDNGSESIAESVRNAFLADLNATPTPTPTPPPTPTPYGKIVFMAELQTFESVPEIYIMDSNGANRAQVTATAWRTALVSEPAWSPDGTRIVHTKALIEGIPPQIMPSYIAVDGTPLTSGNGSSQPAWSPDGTRISFTRNGEIFVMNADGSNQTNLTNNPAFDSNSNWSPDSMKIVFTRDGEIYVMNADGSNQTRLTNNAANDYNSAWSPDGTKIAFASNRDGNAEIYVMDADGANQTRLTNDAANDYKPTWSPDGARLAFTSNRVGNNDIWVMDANGSNPTNLTNNTLPDYEPNWQRVLTPPPPPTPTPTLTPSPTPTPTPTLTPSPTGTPASPTPTPSTTATATATPTASATATPTATATTTPPLTPTPTPTATPTSTPSPAAQALNLSTRMRIQTGDNAGIGGFIITGTAPKHLLLRAIGPSLTQFGVPDALADPVLELHGPGAFVTIVNDNWRDDPAQEAAILATGIPPANNLESAIDAALAPGAYTAIVRGIRNTSGVALIEVYDLNQPVNSKLANISTRAFVSTGDNIVIGGFLLGGHSGEDRIVVRGMGPSLAAAGVPNALADPTLELRDSNGALLASNNDWRDDPAQAAELTAAGLAPANQFESGIAATLPPGAYTALLAGRNNGTGVGLVEVYDRGAP